MKSQNSYEAIWDQYSQRLLIENSFVVPYIDIENFVLTVSDSENFVLEVDANGFVGLEAK